MELVINGIAFGVAYLGMEGVAWFSHKYIMHGFLWFLHEDHHKKTPQSFWEKNDWFFVLFATPGITLILLGAAHGFNYLFFLGLGIAVYGLSYFLVHDVFIHQRFPYFRRTNNGYFAAIRNAHRTHHIYKEKEGGECFGMLLVPTRFFKGTKTSKL